MNEADGTLSREEFRRRVLAVGDLAAEKAPDRAPFLRALRVLDELLAAGTAPDRVRLPWRCPRHARAALVAQARALGAPILAALKALWTECERAGLLQGPLSGGVARARALVTRLSEDLWGYTPLVAALARALRTEAAYPRPGNDRPTRERVLVGNAVLALALSGIAPASLPRLLATVRLGDIDWRAGRIDVVRRRAARLAPQRYRLGRCALLHLGVLAWFFAGTRAGRRFEGGCVLPPRWRDPARIAAALRERVHALAPAEYARVPWHLPRFLATCRIVASLDRPPVLVAYLSGQLKISPGDVDLTGLGLPLVGPQHSVRLGPGPRQRTEPPHPPASPGPSVDRVWAVLRGLRAGAPREELLERADRMEALQRAWREEPGVSNARLFAEYAVWVLRHSRSSATARNRLAALRVLDELCGGTPLVALDPDEAQELAAGLVQGGAPGSVRVRRAHLRALWRFAQDRGYPVPAIRWNDPDLRAPTETTWQPLLTHGEAESVAEAAWEAGDRGLAVAVILGFFCGLRVGELVRLRVDALRTEFPGELAVTASKTRHGLRTLFTHLLVPPTPRSRVEYHAQRSATSGPTAPLIVDAKGAPYSSDRVASVFARLTGRVLGRSVGIHSLRRSFASWLLVKFLMARGMCRPLAEPSAWGREALSPEALVNIARLFENFATTRNPELAGLWILSTLLGHGSPLTAVGHYLAAVEWLPYLLDDHEEGFDVPLDAAARLLGLKGPRRLQQIARRDASRVRGRIDADHVIALLVERLTRLLRGDENRRKASAPPTSRV